VALSPGTRLGAYEIQSLIGSGGMGEVYRARDPKLNRTIAVKVLSETTAADPERRARFEREAQSIAALSHPNIVTIHSVEQAEGVLFLTMEYVEGKPLSEMIVKGGLPLSQILSIAIPLADAISAAHQKGITHRDLKPANVMIAGDGRVKVLDFGLAKMTETSPVGLGVTGLPTGAVTGEGRIVGTVAYMSPEQAEGKAADQRSDLFALGVILYELATGERPFKGDSSMSILTAVLRDTPRPVSEIKPALPPDLSRIVRRCLAKDPARRYQSAQDVRNDLEDVGQSADSGGITSVAVVEASRRSWVLPAALVSILALAGITAAMRFRTPSTSVARVPTASHRRLTQMEGVQQFPSISPDGKWVAYVSALAGNNDIYLQSVTGQTPINLTKDSPASDIMPAFSPDGDLIAFRSERDGGGIFVMGRTGESVRRLTTFGFYPAWYPDGHQIVFSTEGSGPENRSAFSELWAVSASGGEPRLLVPGDAIQPRVSPHAQRIAFWAVPADRAAKRMNLGGPANRDIWTVDLNGQHPVRVTTHEANDWNPVWSPDGRWLYFLSNRAGSMNLWRARIDEASGAVSGEPMALTAPTPYLAHFTLSADGTVGAYASLVSTSNIGRVAFDSRSATVKGPVQAVTTGSNDYIYFDVTSDGEFVVASTSSRTQEDLYVISSESGATRQLTNDFARDRAPRWLPDRRHIVFYSDRTGYGVWTIDADGSGLRLLTNANSVIYPVPSRDGTRLAAVDADGRQLFIYAMNDFSKPSDVPPPFNAAPGYPLPMDWSPDGRFLVFGPQSSGRPRRDLWVYSRDTRTYRPIANRGADGAAPTPTAAAWLSDSRRLVQSGARGRLFVVDVATGTSRELLTIPGEFMAEPRLTADDSQLFFQHGTTSGNIWVVRFDDRATSDGAPRP
jgi:serine/threonine protein kinase